MAGGVAVGIGGDQRVVVDVVGARVGGALKVARNHAHHAGAGVDREQCTVCAAQGVGERANGAAHAGGGRGVGGVFCHAAVGQVGEREGGDFHHIGHRHDHGLFCRERGIGPHIAGDDGEAVAGLALKVSAVLQGDGASGGIDVERGHVASQRFQAVDHGAVVCGDVGVSCGGRVDDGADRRVFWHGAGVNAGEHRGVVVAVNRDLEGAGGGRLGV